MPPGNAKKLTVGSLFAGIGGFDLAAERAGLEVKWQVEIDDYATRVLEKHWPGARRYRDIRAIDWSTVEPVDVVCGGFPCQPHSLAGKRLATADNRDLWPEVVRCLRGLMPAWFLGENVTGLLSSEAGRFFGTVLGDLAACGFDAEWDCIPASARGANHQRDRVWIVAYPNGPGQRERRRPEPVPAQFATAQRLGQAMADADDSELERRKEGPWRRDGREGAVTSRDIFRGRVQRDEWWEVEPAVGRVVDGIPARVDRLRGLGNSIVPAVAEWVFSRIIEAEGRGVER